MVKHNTPFVAAVTHFAPSMSLVDFGLLALIYMLFLISWLARTPVTNGDFILTTRETHLRINGFKEGAILGEDTDYGLRAVRAGARYRFYLKPYIIASDRRVREMGRIKLIFIMVKGLY